ncbi:hypothetical protein ACN38_g12064, partial [Penicillium nordicum]
NIKGLSLRQTTCMHGSST